MLYPQNGDRIVAIDSVTSFHPVHTDDGVLYVHERAGDGPVHVLDESARLVRRRSRDGVRRLLRLPGPRERLLGQQPRRQLPSALPHARRIRPAVRLQPRRQHPAPTLATTHLENRPHQSSVSDSDRAHGARNVRC